MIFTSLFSVSQQSGAAPSAGGGIIQMLFMFGLIFVIFYLLIIMPQRKKQKKHQEMVGQLKPGDKLITTGGIYGTVMGTQKDKIDLKISANTKINITKTSTVGMFEVLSSGSAIRTTMISAWKRKAIGKAIAFLPLLLSATKNESLKISGIFSFFFDLTSSAIFIPHINLYLKPKYK